MDWPLMSPAVPESELPLFNRYYLDTCRASCDPTMVWGTEIETRRLTEYLQQVNLQSGVLSSPAHLLVRAVGKALVRYPQFNRRVLGRRIYRFRDVNVLMPLRKRQRREADVCLLRNVDSRPLAEIAAELWRHNRDAARGEFVYDHQERLFRRLPRFLARRLFQTLVWATNNLNQPLKAYNEQLRAAPVLVNYLSFTGAPPLRSFKPSRFPSDCVTLSVTLGPTERRPVALRDQILVQSVAPLFVRADHRIVDAYELGQFVAALRDFLSDPGRMDLSGETSDEDNASEEGHAHGARPRPNASGMSGLVADRTAGAMEGGSVKCDATRSLNPDDSSAGTR